MADVWMPDVWRVEAYQDGGSTIGGASRVLWSAVNWDPSTYSGLTTAQAFNATNHAGHLVWNPVTGEIVQMIPANKAGKRGDAELNRQGLINIQISVLTTTSKPFTGYACIGLAQIMNWVRTWGIPDAFPGGPPVPIIQQPVTVSTNTWKNTAGHFVSDQVPVCTLERVGAIDIKKILGAK